MRRAHFHRSYSARFVSNKARGRSRFRPLLESLEDRSLLATIVVDTFNDVVADDGQTSLREAIAEFAALPGDDTIELPAGTYPLSLGQLTINDASGSVTIESTGGVATIDAQFASRVLQIVAGSQVNLAGLVISGGFDTDGAGILNAGNLTIENSTVRFNFAFSRGGGLYNNLGTAALDGVTFDTNFAGFGGGISNNHVLSVTSSTFVNNTSTSLGGAIDNIGGATVSDTRFERNSGGLGGGIHNRGGLTALNGALAVEGSLFDRNVANSDGGGIYNNRASITVEESRFVANRAGRGGGIHNTFQSTVVIADSELSGNLVNVGSGAGLFNGGSASIADSSVSGNTVNLGQGGGIFSDLAASLSIADSLVDANAVLFGDGGGIFNRGMAAIADSSVSGNLAGGGQGGGIANFRTMTVTGSTLDGNSSNMGGGIASFATTTISDSSVSGNFVSLDGGGIYVAAGAASVSDCNVNGNAASSGGGIYNGATITVIDSTLSGNMANFRGGGLLNFRSATVSGSTFSGNSASSDSGGGIYSEGSFSASATLSVTASTFSGNTSAFFGGGVFSGSQNTATVATSTFSDNSSLLGGGIANFGTASLSVVNGTFSGNSAVFAGGGIYNASFDGSASLAVTSSTISGNSSANGGGIFNFDAATIRNTIVALNSGDFGPDVSGSFTSSGYNLIGIGDGSSGFGATGDQVGTAASPIDPLLGPLADNGGPTWTMALLPGSPALNAGDPSLAGTTDQRGVLRPQGPGVDIGGFELEYQVVDVEVKPGSDGGPINLNNANGLVPVAIYGSADFDVSSVDLSNLSLIKLGDPTLSGQASPVSATLEDKNGDGVLDLVLFFSVGDLVTAGALNTSSTSVLLTAFTLERKGIFGLAAVEVVGMSPV